MLCFQFDTFPFSGEASRSAGFALQNSNNHCHRMSYHAYATRTPNAAMDVGRIDEEEIRWHTRTGSLILTKSFVE